MAEGVFGSIGLALASIYLIPQRIVMWSAGVSYFAAAADDNGVERVAGEVIESTERDLRTEKHIHRVEVFKRVATHPCIIAVVIGVVFMFMQVKLPAFLDAALKDLGACNTAMSMLVIGTILADVKAKDMLDKTVFFFSGLRLLIIPLLTYIGCLLCHVEGLATGVSVLLAAMPAASTTAILAAKYDGDAVFASKCVVTTTVLSLLTTPVWSMILLSGMS